MNRTKDVDFDYQAYMKDYAPDPGDIHWGPEARQKRREAVIHNNRGVTYANKGDYDCAIQAFTKAMELNPDLAMAYSNRGGAYRDKGDYDRAIEDCTKAIALNPDLAMAYNNRGVAYYKKRDYDRAIVDYTKAIELKPGFAEGVLQSRRSAAAPRRVGKRQIKSNRCCGDGGRYHRWIP